MTPHQLAAEYRILLDTVDRVSRELGQIDIETIERHRHLRRLEAHLASLQRTTAATTSMHISLPEPDAFTDLAQSTLSVAPISPARVAAPPAPGNDPRGAGTSGNPTFTRIVVPTSGDGSLPPSAAGTLVRADAPVRPNVVDERPSRRPPLWSRVPDRYRRAAWIGAPIVVVMAVSTWMTSAGSENPDPVAVTPGQSRSGVLLTSVSGVTPTSSPQTTPSNESTQVSSLEPSPTRFASPGITSTRPAQVTPSAQPATNTAEVTPTSVGASATVMTSPPTSTAASPPPDPTETPSPTPTVAPTETPDPATVLSRGEIVPGGVGSTEVMIVETFGIADGEQDGRSVYSGGRVLVTYGAGSLALWVTFLLDLDEFEMLHDEAESLASFYRPPDAQLVSQQVVEPGFIRRIYTSPTVAALFAGSDTGGRATDRYVEELRFDPATQRAISIEMALDENP